MNIEEKESFIHGLRAAFFAAIMISAVFVSMVSNVSATIFFQDDMESGPGGWTSDGLWHQTKDRAYSPVTSWVYNDGVDYDTGVANMGNLTSPVIDLTTATIGNLTFWTWYETEGGMTYDQMWIQISEDGGPFVDEYHINPTTMSTWTLISINITSHVGHKIQIRFFFDTVDDIDNFFEGWYIDDVEVNDVPLPPPPSFEPPHDDYGLDTDGDPYYNYLVVNVTVNISVAGDYEISGTLYDIFMTQIDFDSNFTFLNPGIQIVELRFEGWWIRNNGEDGPYTINLELYDDSMNLQDTDTHTTNFYTYDQFQPPPASFEPPHSDYGEDTDGDGDFNYLVVNVTVNVSVAGDYRIEGVLRDVFGSWIDFASNSTFLNPGIQTVQLRFDGTSVYNNGVDGPYTVYLDLYDASMNWLDSDIYTTTFYTYDEFQPPPASFEPSHSDNGEDTDGDGDFNYLVVNVTVNVTVAGNYQVEGGLEDSFGSWIDFASNFTFLNLGIQTVQLRFDGTSVYNNGVDGPYTVYLDLYDVSMNWLDSDTYTTTFYTYDEFQRPPGAFESPHSDYGEDTDGDGDFNYLIVNVTVNVSVAGNYAVSGVLRDSFSNWIDDDFNSTFLNAGVQTVQLRFDGMSIYDNGVDGPYTVELELYDASMNLLDTDTYTTTFYTYDEFQPIPALFEPPHSDNGEDTDGDGDFNYLVVNVTVNVTVAGNYQVYGELRDSFFNWIDDDSNLTFLNAGIQTVQLRFAGMSVYNNGVDGPYDVYLDLYDNLFNLLDTDMYTTTFYTYDQFQRPSASFEPPHSDYGEDTDGDPYYNYLVVNVTVNISVAGNYEVGGDLYDSFPNWIDFDSNFTFLNAGIQTVQLRFSGVSIYNNGVDGPYTVELELYDDSTNLLDTDTYTTTFYTYDQFQYPGALFEPPYSDHGLDTDGDGDFNCLVVNVTVNVTVAGNYRVYGYLYDSFFNLIDSVSNFTFLNAGVQLVELRFDGISIYSHGVDGPYIVLLYLYDGSMNLLDTDMYTTSPYTYGQFQRIPALFEPPHSDNGLDTDGDPYYNYLVVNVTVNVTTPGNYEVYGELYDGFSTWIDDDTNFTFLNAGIQIVELRFEGVSIYGNGVDGPYTVELELYDGSMNLLDTDTYTTTFYTYDEFQRPPSFFEPPHSDYGLDTDGDPYYNYLVVNVTVNVSVAGNYRISGSLYDGASTFIDGDSNFTFLNAGIQTVQLRFDGMSIYNNGMDGPYTVELYLYDDSMNLLDTDLYTTTFYTYDEFQPIPALFEPPYSDNGEDTDGDGDFNYLVVNVTVNVTVAGNYRVYGELYDSFSTWIDDDINYTFLNTGIQTVQLRFHGLRIYNNGVDGPYTVELYLYDEFWNWLDSDTYITTVYKYDQFQSQLALFEPPHSDNGLDTDGDPYYNYLVVNVTVNVTTPGNYEVYGELWDSFLNWIDDNTNFTFLNAGIQVVELRFDGRSIYDNGVDGSYTVELYLYDDSMNLLDTDTYTTTVYTYDEFQPPPALFEPPHSDYGLDTDGDPYYNYLVVNVTVNVTTPGNYRVYGELWDSFFNWIDDNTNITFLNAGIQVVELRFDGRSIYDNGIDGSYTVELYLYDDSMNLLDTDTYTTTVYTYDEFQPPPALFEPPHSDYGLDTDGDGDFNYLVVNVTVNVSVADNYRVTGILFDSFSTYIDGVSNLTFLNVGTQIVELRFYGVDIYVNGVDGPYTVELYLYDDSMNLLDNDTYTTTIYTYDQFQPQTAKFKPPHSDNGLDTDGDGFYNYLVVNVTVNVSVAGDHRVQGSLLNSSFVWIDSDSNLTYLNTGIQTVQLRFDGTSIYNNGDYGSYIVNLWLYDASMNLLDFDTYTTTVYTYDEFQPPVGVDILIVTGTDKAPIDVDIGQTDVEMLQLTLTAGSGSIEVTDIRVDLSGTGVDTDVAAVRLYNDTDDSGDFTPGVDEQLGTTQTFLGGSLTFSGLSFNVSSGTPESLLIVFDISTTATAGVTVGCEIVNNSYITVTAPDIVGPFASINSTNSTLLVDTTPPTVTSRNPTSPPAVSIGANIVIVFSESMNTTSVQNAFSYTDGTTIWDISDGSVSWNSPTNDTITFTPSANFVYSTTYTVRINGSIAKDLSGNTLDGNGNGTSEGSPVDDYSWSFTTEPVPDTTPPTSSVGSLDPYQTTLTFDISWTADDLNGIKYVELYYTTDGGSTWHKYATTFTTSPISFTAPGDGDYGFYLVATDNSPNENSETAPSGGTSPEATTTVDTTPPTIDIGPDVTTNSQFTQDASAGDDGSGIVSYAWTKVSGPGTITFGTSAAEDTTVSANTDGTYVIRLTVTDNAGNSAYDEFTLVWDTTSPTITTAAPTGTGVSVATTISITFNEAMDQASVENAFNYTDGTTVWTIANGSVSWSDNTMIFTPDSALSYGTGYTVNIGTGAQDSAGNGLASAYTWSFTTMQAPDTTSPKIASVSLTGTDVEVTNKLSITFNEPMNHTSVEEAIIISPDIEILSYSWDGNTLTMTFASDLEYDTEYNVTIGTGAKDAAGNALEHPYSWSFTTKAKPEEGVFPLWLILLIVIIVIFVLLILFLMRGKGKLEELPEEEAAEEIGEKGEGLDEEAEMGLEEEAKMEEGEGKELEEKAEGEPGEGAGEDERGTKGRSQGGT